MQDNPIRNMRNNLQSVLGRELEGAANMIIPIVVRRIRTKGQHGSGTSFSTPYSRSHKRRRNNEGLQTGYKDLTFTGSMLDNFQITETIQTGTGAKVTIAFEGQNERRRDQKAASNQQVANWLSDSKQENKNIVELSKEEEKMIERYMEERLPTLLERVSVS